MRRCNNKGSRLLRAAWFRTELNLGRPDVKVSCFGVVVRAWSWARRQEAQDSGKVPPSTLVGSSLGTIKSNASCCTHACMRCCLVSSIITSMCFHYIFECSLTHCTPATSTIIAKDGYGMEILLHFMRKTEPSVDLRGDGYRNASIRRKSSVPTLPASCKLPHDYMQRRKLQQFPFHVQYIAGLG